MYPTYTVRLHKDRWCVFKQPDPFRDYAFKVFQASAYGNRQTAQTWLDNI